MKDKTTIIVNESTMKILGEIVFLMASCLPYQKYPLDFITNCVLPSLYLNQYRIYRTIGENKPIGFVSWAFLSDEVEQKIIDENNIILNIEEWQSGKNLFIMDFIAPFGHAKKIVQDLKDHIFPNNIGKGLRLTQDGKKVRKVAIYKGKNLLINNR